MLFSFLLARSSLPLLQEPSWTSFFPSAFDVCFARVGLALFVLGLDAQVIILAGFAVI